MLFGGVANDFACSTNSQSIDNQAYVDGWGDSQYCVNPVAEDFKVNTFYDCGSEGCAYSAYVDDHGGACSSAVNYCYASGLTVSVTEPVPFMSRTSMFILSMVVLLVGFGVLRNRFSRG